MSIYRLENRIQPYAWGSRTAIAELLGQPGPTDDPQAELWLGTHPKGPSMAVCGDTRMLLPGLILQRPVEILGNDAVQRFGKTLPYLFKVLAAARPLSIQAHPNHNQAKEGFAREEREGVPIDAPHRNYRDDNHKPEIICALTPFWGLNGFRSVETAISLLVPVCPKVLTSPLKELVRTGERGLKDFFISMMTLSDHERIIAAGEVRDKAETLTDKSNVYRWMVDLSSAYPGDMGIVNPALLNLICLSPGQAMYLPAGQLHAYLDGVGIELMANSDNVLRGGLTPKHVDVPELLEVVRFEETVVEIIQPTPLRPAEFGYACPVTEFGLSVIQTSKDRSYRSPAVRNVEIILCTKGSGRIADGDKEQLSVKKGDSFLIPANLASYGIEGDLTIYKATVP